MEQKNNYVICRTSLKHLKELFNCFESLKDLEILDYKHADRFIHYETSLVYTSSYVIICKHYVDNLISKLYIAGHLSDGWLGIENLIVNNIDDISRPEVQLFYFNCIEDSEIMVVDFETKEIYRISK
jgi:hypothetical protein